MYVVTSTLFVRRARATLRNAEFGFFGVCVYTRMQTPRFSGQPCSAGDFVLLRISSRPLRTNCENVGTDSPRIFRHNLLFVRRGFASAQKDDSSFTLGAKKAAPEVLRKTPHSETLKNE